MKVDCSFQKTKRQKIMKSKLEEQKLIGSLTLGDVVHFVIAVLVFAAISGNFSVGELSWVDVLMGAVVGLICGVIAVNVKKSAKNT